jgi:hypothetical protein
VAGSGGAGGVAGSGGAGGAGGTPVCLHLLTTSQQINAALQGLAVTKADLDHDASGNPVVYSVMAGDSFYDHASVTFISVDTSDQASVGSTSSYVVATPPSEIVSYPTVANSFAGFDGLRSLFATAQTVVSFTGTVATGQQADGFALVVGRSDATQTTTFTLPTTMAPLAGVQSSCGPIITTLDVLPNRVTGGEHMSSYWSMTSLSFGR